VAARVLQRFDRAHCRVRIAVDPLYRGVRIARGGLGG